MPLIMSKSEIGQKMTLPWLVTMTIQYTVAVNFAGHVLY